MVTDFPIFMLSTGICLWSCYLKGVGRIFLQWSASDEQRHPPPIGKGAATGIAVTALIFWHSYTHSFISVLLTGSEVKDHLLPI